MLEIVDADLRRFAITDRAKMSGDFQPALVRFLYHSAQLGAADVHINLERGGTLIGPEVHHAARVVGPCNSCITGVNEPAPSR